MILKSLIRFVSIFLLVSVLIYSSCKDIIEPSISTYKIFPEAPVSNYQSSTYKIDFWWDEVADASSYHLQVVKNTFASPESLVLDTVISKNKYSYSFDPGNYQWKVLAQNGSSKTPYADARSFTVLATSIKQQAVQLNTPANNFLTNQTSLNFQWNSLYGANKYRFEIDTNNFSDENNVISNQLVPGQQLIFSFPKDRLYQWRVRAENDTAQSLWSAINYVTYDHTPPVAVTLTGPSNNQTIASPVNLQWNAVATANRYKIYAFKSDSTSNYSASFPLQVTGTNYSFTSGNSGETVYWEVSALDAAGNEGQASTLRHFIVK